mgnify:CR=1 FL=1
MELPNKPLLRVGEVAQFFGVTNRTVYSWIAKKWLDIEWTPGKQIRVATESVNKCRHTPRED